MLWINNFKLMFKLMFIFGVILLVMLFQGIVVYCGLYLFNNVIIELVGYWMESICMVGEICGMVGEYCNFVYQGLICVSDDVKVEVKMCVIDLCGKIDVLIKKYLVLIDNLQQKQLFDIFVKDWNVVLVFYDLVIEMFELDLLDDVVDIFVGEICIRYCKVFVVFEVLIVEDNCFVCVLCEEVEFIYVVFVILIVIVLFGGVVLGLVLVWLFVCLLVGSVCGVVLVVNDVVGGKFDGYIDVICKDEVGDLLQVMQCMQCDLCEWIEIDQVIVCENLCICIVLDYSFIGVYLIDDSFNIVYINCVLQYMFIWYQDEICKDLLDFDVVILLIGKLVIVFEYGNEMDQCILSQFKEYGVSCCLMQFGDVQFVQVVFFIVNEQGDIVGYVVEWCDCILEVVVEVEVVCVIVQVVVGDLFGCIDDVGKEGFFL